MAIHDNFPAGRLITNGLGGNGCDSFVIATQFHLYCFDVVVLPGSGGGSRPLAHGEIANFYKPVSATDQIQSGEEPYLTPYDYDPTDQKTRVTIRVKFGEHESEKEFLVSEKRANVIIKVGNFINATRAKFSASVSGIKKVATKATVIAKNIHKKLW